MSNRNGDPVFGAPAKVAKAPAVFAAGAGRQVNPAQSRLNSVIAWMLVCVIGLAPLPIGSNRPALWMAWAVVIGVMAAVFSLGVAFSRGAPRIRLSAMWPEMMLFAALLGFLVFQMLPLSSLLPLEVHLPDGGKLAAATSSLDPDSTYLQSIVFMTLGLFFLLVRQVAVNRQRARRLLFAIFVIIVAMAVFGLVSLIYLGDTILGFEKRYYLGDATGTFIHRGSFALFLGMGFAIGMPLLIAALLDPSRRPIERLLVGALIVCGQALILAAVLLSSSRWGALSTMIGGGVGFTLSVALMQTTGRLKLVLTAAGTLALAAVGTLYANNVLLRIVTSQGNAGRDALYPQVWDAIMSRPWLGYGAGSFTSVFPVFERPPLSGDLYWDRAHSAYLSLWFELGLLAGSIPIAIVAVSLVRTIWTSRTPSNTLLAVAGIAASVVFAVACAIDISGEMLANQFLFVALLALGIGKAGGDRMKAETMNRA